MSPYQSWIARTTLPEKGDLEILAYSLRLAKIDQVDNGKNNVCLKSFKTDIELTKVFDSFV